MIETQLSPHIAATVVHRVSGDIGLPQAEQGARDALLFVQQVSANHDRVNLLLDLRGKRFQDFRAHRAWSLGFLRHPQMHNHIKRIAILADDSPEVRAEQEAMETDWLKFFFDLASSEQWLEN